MDLDSAERIAPIIFSNSYTEARRKFQEAAPPSRAYQCSKRGPSGEILFTDAAYLGHPNAKRVLILISGAHGPEGYCGSAAQILFLRSALHERLPTSTAVLLIHALNSYGFAWDRRITAEGCDLNRNFVNFSMPLPRNVGYEELHEHLVPVDLSPERLGRAELAMEAYRSAHGLVAFREAVGAGQYSTPGGMFYGGREPSEARLILERIANEFDLSARDQVIIIDYHTGLGPYGYGELQCEQPSGLPGYERALKIFGPSVTSPELGTSSSVIINGTQDEFWQRELGERHTYVCLEFGTHRNVREVMRNDQWLSSYHPEDVDSKMALQIRHATKAYFYPEKLDWKEMVAWRSHQVHRQAIEALRN